ncbi:pilus assembly protein [Francisella tularensis subsp. holarctica F92]|nr:pilus assembly protein [Francisella tularensis subsp. holarctica F92]
MQRANEIYVNANATVIDDPAVLSDIEVARNTLLLPSTAVIKYWSIIKFRKYSNCYSCSFR